MNKVTYDQEKEINKIKTDFCKKRVTLGLGKMWYSLLFLFLASKSSSACQASHEHEGTAFGINYFYSGNNRLTFKRAQRFCANRNMMLPTLDDENAFLGWKEMVKRCESHENVMFSSSL